jgi:hypothetical protein
MIKFVNKIKFNQFSVVYLRMLIVERSPNALLLVRPEVNEFWQPLHPGPVGQQFRVLFEHSVGLAQEVHVVQKLKQHKVHVVHIITDTEGLVTDKSLKLGRFLIDEMLELLRLAEPVCVVDQFLLDLVVDSRKHLSNTELHLVATKQAFVPLPGCVLKDRFGLSELDISVNQVGKIREV